MLSRCLLPFAALACFGTAATAQSATEALPVGCDELKSGQNTAAIAEIRGSEVLSAGDPARLINLGVAFAREGDEEQARTHFRAALNSEERASLQTVAGEWVDSRELARQGLRKLARGEFAEGRLASLR